MGWMDGRTDEAAHCCECLWEGSNSNENPDWLLLLLFCQSLPAAAHLFISRENKNKDAKLKLDADNCTVSFISCNDSSKEEEEVVGGGPPTRRNS